MVTQVAENAMQTSRVELGVVDEQQDEKTRQTLVVQQLSTSELLIVGGGEGGNCGLVTKNTASSDASVDASPCC